MKRFACFALTTLLLSGCASDSVTPEADADSSATPSAPAAPSSAEGYHSCRSEAVSTLRGQTASASLLEQARQASGAYQVRVVGPDDVVTMDYNSQRLTLGVDARGVVQDISCG